MRALLLPLCLALLASPTPPPVASQAAPAPAQSPPAGEVRSLLQQTAFVRSLDEAALVQLVPEQAGLRYVGCPNCSGGRQENQLTWSPERPEEVRCQFCGHRFPSEKYPETGVVEAKGPDGRLNRYPYWADAKGYRNFFRARRDDLVRLYLAAAAADLGRLYAASGERVHARRAALILDRFAQVFPGWCYHYDYPFQQKEIYEGAVAPAQFRPGYRTARWTWWAYSDVPSPLVQAYRSIQPSGVLAELSRERGTDVAARIERDLFRNAADQVLANPEAHSNMSPGMWRSLIQLGRTIAEPRYVHEPLRRLREFVRTRFFYDGSWPEGSPDYHAQTLGGLEQVLSAARGYTDPAGYRDPVDGSRFENLDLDRKFPELERSRAALARLRFPDGRHLTIHDSWPTSRRGPLAAAEPYLLPALGHACLGSGTGDRQSQLHLSWSGGYGHQHADLLSLILFSHGRELLSDLGYTHTAYRSWTLASVAHNTVVVDGESQAFGGKDEPTDGSLRWYEAGDPRVQSVSAEAGRAYPGKTEAYRRTLVSIDTGEGRRYAVDLFEVKGGGTHDYFLHGDADAPASVSAELPLTPLATLLPAGFEWQPTRNEGEARRHREPHYAYGFLRALRAAPVPAGRALPVTFAPAAGNGPRLRATLLPEAGSRLVLGENPSIRPAGENDSKLETFTRPFLLLRREAKGSRSAFAAVLEPYAGSPLVHSVERLTVPGAALALRVALAGRTDLVVIGAPKPVKVPAGGGLATFCGELGVLTLRGEKVEHAYALGAGGWEMGKIGVQVPTAPSHMLERVEDSALVLKGVSGCDPAPGDVVRLRTADGWVYPYTVVSPERDRNTLRLRVAEGPGFVFDPKAQSLRCTAFPQREHSGSVRVEWTPHRSRTIEPDSARLPTPP